MSTQKKSMLLDLFFVLCLIIILPINVTVAGGGGTNHSGEHSHSIPDYYLAMSEMKVKINADETVERSLPRIRVHSGFHNRSPRPKTSDGFLGFNSNAEWSVDNPQKLRALGLRIGDSRYGHFGLLIGTATLPRNVSVLGETTTESFSVTAKATHRRINNALGRIESVQIEKEFTLNVTVTVPPANFAFSILPNFSVILTMGETASTALPKLKIHGTPNIFLETRYAVDNLIDLGLKINPNGNLEGAASDNTGGYQTFVVTASAVHKGYKITKTFNLNVNIKRPVVVVSEDPADSAEVPALLEPIQIVAQTFLDLIQQTLISEPSQTVETLPITEKSQTVETLPTTEPSQNVAQTFLDLIQQTLISEPIHRSQTVKTLPTTEKSQTVETLPTTEPSQNVDPLRTTVLIAANERPAMYWIDKQTGRLLQLIDAEVEYFNPSIWNVTSFVVHRASGKVYWIENWIDGGYEIYSANIDGTNVLPVKTLTGTPFALALDAVGGKLYLTNTFGKIQRLNVDGTDYQPNLITGLTRPRYLAVDGTSEKVYWTERTSSSASKIFSANLDGTDVQLVKTLTRAPKGIAVDGTANKLYLTSDSGFVQRLNVDGTNFQPHLIVDLDSLRSLQNIAVDAGADKIYWIEGDKIRRADRDGMNLQDVVVGLSPSTSITLAPIPVPVVTPAAPTQVNRDPDPTILLANYPNPFNPETWIPYQLQKPGDVKITIYSSSGVLVRELSLGHRAAGRWTSRGEAAYWDGKNEFGEKVTSGIYFYQLNVNTTSLIRKMVILK